MDYDFFCSLGGSCAVSHQLKERRLRVASLPFDWLFCVSDRTIEALTECFRNDFADWMRRENLRELAAQERGQSTIFQCEDTATGYRFIHDFHADPAAGNEYDSVLAKYRRRIERLYEYLKKSQRIALLFDADFELEPAKFARLRQVLLDKFGPKTALDLYIVHFGAPRLEVECLDGMTIYHFPTSKHSYLYKYKCMEFSFLDDMRLTGAIPQPRGRGRRLEINRLPHGFRLILFRSRPLRFKAAVRIFRNWFEVVIGNLWE